MIKPLTNTWIDQKLSYKDREKLIDYLLERSANPTAAQIHDALGELFAGKDIPSERSCGIWKAKSWAFVVHLRKLGEDSELAKIIAENSGGDIAGANKRLADAYVFNQLRALNEGRLKEVDPNVTDWILASARLAKRTADDSRLIAQLEKSRAQVDIYKTELAEYARKEAERAAATAKLKESVSTAKAGGLTKAALESIERQLSAL